MAIAEQTLTDRFAAYLGDCCEVMPSLPAASVHFSIYSPPFGGLYHYSSNERDLSNCDGYRQFFDHYGFVVREIARLTMPGRLSAVHAVDIPAGNSGGDHCIDFPGDIIRLHEQHAFEYVGRHAIWKEPLGVRNRTMAKDLAHKTVIEDSTRCGLAGSDYLLMFRRLGRNQIPVAHPRGMMEYAGERAPPADILRYRGWSGNQIENRFSHWIWRQYASSFWDDIRIDRVLPFRPSRDEQDEKHVHPLQLDVIDRAVTMRTNPGETVLTPFMGVGSEVYSPLCLGRRGIGIELKKSYYQQAIRNLKSVEDRPKEQQNLFDAAE